MRFHANALDAKLLAFDDRGACATKRIQYTRVSIRIKLLEIVTNQVWRVRKNKAVPIVYGQVFRPNFVERASYPTTSLERSMGRLL